MHIWLLLPFSSPCVWAAVRAAASTPSCLQFWCRYRVTGSHCSNASTRPQSSDTETFSRLPSPALEGPRPLWWQRRPERELMEVGTGVQRPQSPFLFPEKHPERRLATPSCPPALCLGAKHLSCVESGRGGRSCGHGRGRGPGNSEGSRSGSAWVWVRRRRGGEGLRGDRLWKTERSSCASWTTNTIPCWQRQEKLVSGYIILC